MLVFFIILDNLCKRILYKSLNGLLDFIFEVVSDIRLDLLVKAFVNAINIDFSP